MLKEKFDNGEKVILDKGFRNSSIVEVILQSSGKLFTRIKPIEDNAEWEVMTNRLTKISQNDTK